jgi:hypothetical protein
MTFSRRQASSGSSTSSSEGSTTYYDSQSGLHVRRHNESVIHLYQHWSPSGGGGDGTSSSFQKLYKQPDMADEAKEELQELTHYLQGVFWSFPLVFPRDFRNLETLFHMAPSILQTTTTDNNEFTIFAPTPPNHHSSSSGSSSSSSSSSENNNNKIVVVLDYSKTTSHQLQQYKDQGIRTALVIPDYYYYSEEEEEGGDELEPFEVANQIATLMDASSGAGDYVWISMMKTNMNSSHSIQSQQHEAIVQLCEELSYLDVPGPIMKSRLVVDCPFLLSSQVDEKNEGGAGSGGGGHEDDACLELLDQVMGMGVNKFVLYQEQEQQQRQLDMLQCLVNEQGKKLYKTGPTTQRK